MRIHIHLICIYKVLELHIHIARICTTHTTTEMMNIYSSHSSDLAGSIHHLTNASLLISAILTLSSGVFDNLFDTEIVRLANLMMSPFEALILANPSLVTPADVSQRLLVNE